MELNRKNIKKILFISIGIAVIFASVTNIGTVFAALKKLLSFFSPVIVALCIAFVLNVLLSALENKPFKFMSTSRKKFVNRLQRPLCLILTYLFALSIISLLILVIIPDIIDTITYLAEKMPYFVVTVRDWIEGLLERFNFKETELPEIKINWSATGKAITDWLSGSSGKIVGDAVNITTSVFSGIFDTIFSIVISIYILFQKEKIANFAKKAIYAFVPQKESELIYHISQRTHEAFSRFIGGQLTECLILGTLCFIGMTIFRFPNALIISVLISVTALVPIVGATIGVIVGFLLIVITDPIKALLFVVFFLVLQQIEGNLIYPKVVGKAVGLPGVIVVSAVLVGGNIGGVFGALVAVPTCAVIYILLKECIEYFTHIKNKDSLSQENQE